jgi:hypothetical protein
MVKFSVLHYFRVEEKKPQGKISQEPEKGETVIVRPETDERERQIPSQTSCQRRVVTEEDVRHAKIVTGLAQYGPIIVSRSFMGPEGRL